MFQLASIAIQIISRYEKYSQQIKDMNIKLADELVQLWRAREYPRREDLCKKWKLSHNRAQDVIYLARARREREEVLSLKQRTFP